MKKDIFVARLAKGAATSAMIGAAAISLNQVAASPSLAPVTAEECTQQNQPILPGEDNHASTTGTFVVTIPNNPKEWDSSLEREFRRLGLLEAKGNISSTDFDRLEQLNTWRNQLVSPPTVEETFLQIKRDRLLNRMETLLKEYVQFQEATDYSRRST